MEQRWIDEVMNSMKGQQPVHASPFLSTRVLARVSGERGVVGKSAVWAMAIVLVVLVLLNGGLLMRGSGAKQSPDFSEYFGVGDIYESAVK